MRLPRYPLSVKKGPLLWRLRQEKKEGKIIAPETKNSYSFLVASVESTSFTMKLVKTKQ